MKDKKLYMWLVVGAIILLVWLPTGPSARLKASAREIFAPFQAVSSAMSVRVRQTLANMRDVDAFSESADELAQEVFVLRERIRQVDALEQENADLRRIIGFVESAPRRLVPCEVISRRDASGWWSGVRLNRGTLAGITNNQAVITYEGLVGRTVDATRHTADVLLLTDRGCKVAARIVRLGADGVMRGDGVSLAGGSAGDMLAAFNPCRLDYIDKDAEVRVGDRVVTSGLGGIFPADLALGRVVHYDLDESGLYKSASVDPAVSPRRLRHVFVVAQ